MTCIAEHFVSRACLREMYPDVEHAFLDTLRTCCTTNYRRLVKHSIRSRRQAGAEAYGSRSCGDDGSELAKATKELRAILRTASGMNEDNDARAAAAYGKDVSKLAKLKQRFVGRSLPSSPKIPITEIQKGRRAAWSSSLGIFQRRTCNVG